MANREAVLKALEEYDYDVMAMAVAMGCAPHDSPEGDAYRRRVDSAADPKAEVGFSRNNGVVMLLVMKGTQVRLTAAVERAERARVGADDERAGAGKEFFNEVEKIRADLYVATRELEEMQQKLK